MVHAAINDTFLKNTPKKFVHNLTTRLNTVEFHMRKANLEINGVELDTGRKICTILLSNLQRLLITP